MIFHNLLGLFDVLERTKFVLICRLSVWVTMGLAKADVSLHVPDSREIKAAFVACRDLLYLYVCYAV